MFNVCNKKIGVWAAIAIAIVTAVSVGKTHADTGTDTWKSLKVETLGQGPAMVFIPGLTSSSETFTHTCDAFKAEYTCHLLHLPGFAGQPPTATAQKTFLLTMRDTIKSYIHHQKLERPILVGHSLGGVLSLMLAIDDPQLAGALVIVDALPFYPAIHNPQLTADIMQPQAEQMRQQTLSLNDEAHAQSAAMYLTGMSNQPERMPLLLEWSKTSDRTTTAQAMYDMMTTDLRSELDNIKTPTLVLGAWAAYAGYGATQDSTRAIFTSQYAKLAGVDIRMADKAFHFITWDEPEWTEETLREFLNRLN